jgi:long-chain acyl-CoA synthetase
MEEGALPRAAGASTIAEAFRLTVEDHADRVAVRTLNDETALTWAQLRDRADGLSATLASLGVRRGDTVALMLGNRPEFHIADLAAMTLGATPFSVYLTSSPEQVAYVIADAGARVAIVEPGLRPLVEPLVDHVLTPDAWELDPGFDPEPHWRAVAPDDLLTLIYTSGTTGPPKGVQISHSNQMAAARMIDANVSLSPDSRVISWLPSAHVAERTAHHYLPIVFGAQVTCCPDPRQIGAYLPAVRPTWFFAVPRVWEKLKGALEARLDETARAVVAESMRRVERRQAGEDAPEMPAEAQALFAGLRRAIGLDEAVLANVGAAPTPREVLVFFHAIGVPLAEIWGMSETCGAGAANPRDAIRIGTVGKPRPGVEFRLAASDGGDERSARGRGELLMRAPVVMVGYRNLPDRTAEALDDDGWLHTGDVAEIDADGYVRIVDRKKELIISAGGKNMSPANIEAAIKGATPLLSQACVIGDGRRYNTALLVLDAEVVAALGLPNDPSDERVRAAVQTGVDKANAQLSRPEQVKRFTLVAGDWLPGGDELTPTMKLKRRPIADKYAEAIEAMYAQAESARGPALPAENVSERPPVGHP